MVKATMCRMFTWLIANYFDGWYPDCAQCGFNKYSLLSLNTFRSNPTGVFPTGATLSRDHHPT